MTETEAQRTLRAAREAQKNKPGRGKRTLLYILLAIGGLVVIGLFASPNTKAPNTPGTVAPEQAPREVTAKELFQAYQDNEVAAQQAYGQQTISIAGTVQAITLDLLDEPVVQLVTTNQFMPVSAYGVDKDGAAALKSGQQVRLLCDGVSEVASMPQLQNCRLTEQP